MGGDTDNFHSFVVGLPVGGGSGKSGQKRGVNIENPVFPVPDKVGGENLHEAGQNNEIDLRLFQMSLEGCFGLRPVPIINFLKRKSVTARHFGQMRVVSGHQDRIGFQAAGFPGAQDGFRSMCFLGYQNTDPATAIRSARQTQGQMHAQMPRDFFQLGANPFVVEVISRPRSQ